MYRGVRCRERISLKPTATNLKRAEQHKAAVEHAIANGTFEYAVTFPGSPRAAKFAPEASQETVAGFLTKWLAGKKQHVSSSTFEGYRKLVELRLVPALGPTLLVELKRKTVRDWLNTLEVSNKTLSNIQSCLRSALNDAVDNDELIDTNPLAGWTFSRKDQVKEDDVDPFSPEEQRAILAGNEVFQNPRTMERWKGDQPIRKTMWAHAVKKAGVRYRRPYQTRHTYASMMLSAGEHPMWVAGQMGHSDWTMIARVYGRWMPSADESAGSKALSYWSEDKESEEIREADLKKRR
ncbi:Arm DNA-binding domain-containing protein [Pseudomonas aeruginosa]|uniref:Arm DNA-binding domain-containing protein n=1 Tax=Pseudomonas aeruginosa TaxID=287 RepID=UPI003762C2D7